MLEKDADYQHVFFPSYPFTTIYAYRGGFFTQRDKAVFLTLPFHDKRTSSYFILMCSCPRACLGWVCFLLLCQEVS